MMRTGPALPQSSPTVPWAIEQTCSRSEVSLPDGTKRPGAVDVPTMLAETKRHSLAYRSIGSGEPLILCVRLRGVLDVWDPAFLDALAERFRVITFDYSGPGRSGGDASYDPEAMAGDVFDLADALGLDSFFLGGQSGQGAQAAAVMTPRRIRKLVLIGTTPPGKVAAPSELVFLERVLKFDNDLDDETVLFFEPASEKSQAAAKASHDRTAARTTDLSPVVPVETYMRLLRNRPRAEGELFPDPGGYRGVLATTSIPILVISGDHEIVFPVRNWFDMIPAWRSPYLLVVPQAGRAPQHQEPRFCADAIASFLVNAA